MTDEYVYHLKELASTPTEDFCSFSVVNRAHAYALKIQNDVKWAEEVLIGEGDDSSEFLHLLTKHLLTLSPIARNEQVVMQAYFFDLCDKYMLDTVASEYDIIRNTTC
jgi:hypothetical protein